MLDREAPCSQRTSQSANQFLKCVDTGSGLQAKQLLPLPPLQLAQHQLEWLYGRRPRTGNRILQFGRWRCAQKCEGDVQIRRRDHSTAAVPRRFASLVFDLAAQFVRWPEGKEEPSRRLGHSDKIRVSAR